MIRGTLSPALDGQSVVLQRRRGSGWVDSDSVRVQGGPSVDVTFTVTGSRGKARYRLVAPARGDHVRTESRVVTVRFERAKVVRVRGGADEVKIKNTGAVRIDLTGWTLANAKNGRVVTLPRAVLGKGKSLTIHTGDGRSTRRNLYLDARAMWGSHGKAVLRDATGSVAHRLRY
ncbi:MAG: lamin tail domain-containing protein [Nocardioides sp.]